MFSPSSSGAPWIAIMGPLAHQALAVHGAIRRTNATTAWRSIMRRANELPVRDGLKTAQTAVVAKGCINRSTDERVFWVVRKGRCGVSCRSRSDISQKFVDAHLAAGFFIDLFNDNRAVEAVFTVG